MPSIDHNMGQLANQLGNLVQRYGELAEREIDKEFLRQGTLLYNDLVTLSPVDDGFFRANWHGPIKTGYASVEVRNNTVYGPVINFGGYRGVGPKTARREAEVLPEGIQVQGGIYPTQRPHGLVPRAMSMRAVDLGQGISRIIKR